MNNSFDKYAQDYDAWFLKNINVLYSEAKLVAKALGSAPGRTLSVGCGSGLFEKILREEFNIDIRDGIEPAAGMAEIADKRGMKVQIATAENAKFEVEAFDTVLFNGTPSYIPDLAKAVDNAKNALKSGGRIILIDVPKDGCYSTLYNLAATLGTWEHPLLNDIKPEDPYPIELVKSASWRTTKEKIDILTQKGFRNMEFFQTLTTHPAYTNLQIEEPIAGYDKGDYVAIIAVK
jgi:SAM-dependent methyltransferase